MNERKQDGQQAAQQPPWVWLLLWLGVLWIFALLPLRQGNDSAAIPYSTFINQVTTKNVADVRIAGDHISGTFVKPFAQSTAAPKIGTFQTTFPALVGDTTLLPLLSAHGVVVDVASVSTPWYAGLLLNWLPMLLLGGFILWMAGAGGRGQAGMFRGFGKVAVKRYTGKKQAVTFSDIAGADAAKAELREEVDFLRTPQKYRDLGARIPRGILLVGPPGTGKTLLAKAVAGEAGVPFFSLNASEFVEMFVGVGASRVRDLFTQAKEAAPAIVFIDELDAIGRRRGAGLGMVNDEREQTLNQLLGELDGFDERSDVIVLAATNRPDVLDPALLRPGRFDRQVAITLPEREGREGILRIHAGKLRLSDDVNLALLASMTIGLSGADLANLCNEAALTAARRDHREVTQADFEEALDRVRLGAAHPHLVNPDERRVIAYHEAGHAVVAWFTPQADPVHKVTIIPHGQALGVTEQVPDIERHNLAFSYLKSKLAVMLGGRAAEGVVFGELTTGAEQDLVEATNLARRMVTRWGMGELGPIAFKGDEQQPFLGYEIAQGREYGEAVAARIDENVLRLLGEADREVGRILRDMRDHLDHLASELLSSETVGMDELTRILGKPASAA